MTTLGRPETSKVCGTMQEPRKALPPRVEQALAIELSVTDEVIEEPPVILREATEAPVLEASVDCRQPVLQLLDACAGTERAGLTNRRAVGQPQPVTPPAAA